MGTVIAGVDGTVGPKRLLRTVRRGLVTKLEVVPEDPSEVAPRHDPTTHAKHMFCRRPRAHVHTSLKCSSLPFQRLPDINSGLVVVPFHRLLPLVDGLDTTTSRGL